MHAADDVEEIQAAVRSAIQACCVQVRRCLAGATKGAWISKYLDVFACIPTCPRCWSFPHSAFPLCCRLTAPTAVRSSSPKLRGSRQHESSGNARRTSPSARLHEQREVMTGVNALPDVWPRACFA